MAGALATCAIRPHRLQYFGRPLLQFETYRKELLIVCDAQGLVREVTFTETGNG